MGGQAAGENRRQLPLVARAPRAAMRKLNIAGRELRNILASVPDGG